MFRVSVLACAYQVVVILALTGSPLEALLRFSDELGGLSNIEPTNCVGD